MARILSVACSCVLWSAAHAGLSSGVGFPVGVAVSAGNEAHSMMKSSAYQKQVKADFSEITAGNIMKMSYLHPSENQYTWSEADKLVNWARSNGVKVHGHTLVWHSDYQVPKFMKNYNGDFRKMFHTHCKTIAQHFAGKVSSWDVANEVLDGNQGSCYRDSVFYRKLGKDFMTIAFKAAREGDRSALLYYNDYNTEWDSKKMKCQLKLIDQLKKAGAPIDGIGFQSHIGSTFPDTSVMKKHFKQIVARGLKVKITELDIPIKNGDLKAQKARYKSVIQAYLEVVPASKRGGVTVWGLYDDESWLGAGKRPLLFSGKGPFTKKPAYSGVQEALKAAGGGGSSPPSTPPRPPPSKKSPPSSPKSSPPKPSSGRCTSAWGNCMNSGCCVSGYSCIRANQWYSQCKPGGSSSPKSPPKSPPKSSPKSSPPKPSSSGSCTSAWGNCKNSGCCVSGYKCKRANKWYSQCRK